HRRAGARLVRGLAGRRLGVAGGAREAPRGVGGRRALQDPRARARGARARCRNPAAPRKENDMIRTTLLLFSIALFGALAPTRLEAAFLDPASGDSDESRADRSYEEGTKALDDGDWERAASAFMEAVKPTAPRPPRPLYS